MFGEMRVFGIIYSSTLQNNQARGWSGTDDTSKGKLGTGKGNGKQYKGKHKNKGKGKTTHQERAQRISRDGGTKINKKHKQVKNTEWTDTSWDHADIWTDADWWITATGAQICGPTLHGNKRPTSCHQRILFEHSPFQSTETAFQSLVV